MCEVIERIHHVRNRMYELRKASFKVKILLEGYFYRTLGLPLLMAIYLELLLDWPMVIEKALLMAIEKACCLGSSRAIGLGSVLA